MMRFLVLAAALAVPSTALVAHASMRFAPTPAISAAVPARLPARGPVMAMGGGSIGRAFRALRCPTPKLPGFGKRTGGISGCDGGDGGDGAEATPAPEDDGDENPFVAAWKQYEQLLDEKPLLMKALTSFTGFALGDILAQKFIQKTDPFDWCGSRQEPSPSPLPRPLRTTHTTQLTRLATHCADHPHTTQPTRLAAHSADHPPTIQPTRLAAPPGRFRLFRLCSFGFLVHGTSSHWFYGMLDGKIPGNSAKVVFTKVFIDQVRPFALWSTRACFGEPGCTVELVVAWIFRQ